MSLFIGIIIGIIIAYGLPILIVNHLAYSGKWWTEGEKEEE